MKTTLKLLGIVTLIFASFIGLSGCASAPRSNSSANGLANQEVEKSLTVASVLRFDDLPLPSGFKIMPEESVAFQNDYSRFAFLKYSGRANPDQVVLFFKEQMPLYNWKLINLIEYGTKVMSFEKADENCTITIEGSASKAIIIASLTPKTARNRK